MPIRNRDGKWHYRFWIRGREYSGNTALDATERNRTCAEKLAEARRRRMLQETDPPEPVEVVQEEKGEPLFSEAAAEFLAWAQGAEYRARPSTAARIKTSFASLIGFFGQRPLATILAGDVERYKLWRINVHGVRDVTLRHDLCALSVFYRRFALKFGWVEKNPVAEVTMPSDAEAVRMHVLSREEEQAYFAVARRNATLHDVGRLILLQGCRPDEILSLPQAAVDLERAALTILGGKTRAARRSLDLVAESRGILAGRLARPGTWVFPSPRKAGRPVTKLNHQHDEIAREAGVSFCLYDLRHTFATRMVEAGCDLPTLAAILGHSGLRMVMRYVHPTAQHRAAAMRRFEAMFAPYPRGEQLKLQ